MTPHPVGKQRPDVVARLPRIEIARGVKRVHVELFDHFMKEDSHVASAGEVGAFVRGYDIGLALFDRDVRGRRLRKRMKRSVGADGRRRMARCNRQERVARLGVASAVEERGGIPTASLFREARPAGLEGDTLTRQTARPWLFAAGHVVTGPTLIATAVGLVAAIPAVIFYNKFVGDISRYSSRVEAFADEFSAILSRQLDEKAR